MFILLGMFLSLLECTVRLPILIPILQSFLMPSNMKKGDNVEILHGYW